jgi:hypothetical protein
MDKQHTLALKIFESYSLASKIWEPKGRKLRAHAQPAMTDD